MNQSLVVYDNEGYILQVRAGQPAPREPVGVPFLWVDVPQGKTIVSVDVSVTPHQVVFEDLPPSEIDKLNEKVSEQEQAIIELTMALATLQGGNA